MKRAILLGPVPLSQRELRRQFKTISMVNHDFRIGIDGGTSQWLKCGIQPDLAVGDWDSLPDRKVLKTIRHISLPRSKDRSDFYFAGVAAMEMGIEEWVALGVWGGRPDQELAMLYDFAGFANEKHSRIRSARIISPDAEMVILSEKISVWNARLPLGTVVSMLPLPTAGEGSAAKVTLSGFRYSLKNFLLTPSSHGLSNEVSQGTCEVRLRKGCLLIIIPRCNLLSRPRGDRLDR